MTYRGYEEALKKARTVNDVEKVIKDVFCDVDVEMTLTKLIMRKAEARIKEIEKETK